jgi:hypothetical protein
MTTSPNVETVQSPSEEPAPKPRSTDLGSVIGG